VNVAGLDGEIRAGRHVMQVRVYYEDTDFSGIVYHANYLRFMERGRTNYLRLLGTEHGALLSQAHIEAPGFAFVVRAMQIEFLKSARRAPPSCSASGSGAAMKSWSRRGCGLLAWRPAGRGRFPKACAWPCGRTRIWPPVRRRPERRRPGSRPRAQMPLFPVTAP
jgi:hypothetical protein